MGIGLEGMAVIMLALTAFALVLLIGTVRGVAGFWPGLGWSVLVLLAWGVVSFPIAGLLGLAIGGDPDTVGIAIGGPLSLVLQAVLLAGALWLLVRRPDGTRLTKGRALGVAVAYVALWAVVAATAWFAWG